MTQDKKLSPLGLFELGLRFTGCSTNMDGIPVTRIALLGAGGSRNEQMGVDSGVAEPALGIGLKVLAWILNCTLKMGESHSI